MNSKVKLYDRTRSKKGIEHSHALYCKKSDILFDVRQSSESHTGGGGSDARDSSSNMSHVYSFAERIPICGSFSSYTDLRCSISSVPEFRLYSNSNSENVKAIERHQVESDSMSNTVKSDVMSQKSSNESCAKYSEKVMGARRFVKDQDHYNTPVRDEVKKRCGKSNALRVQVDKHDGLSYVCPEYCDEDGTSHVDGEDTLYSSEPSATRDTPLVFMHNNEKLHEWIKLDLKDNDSFCADRRYTRTLCTNKSKLASSRKRSEITLGPCCVILPRAHGVNTKLLRPVDICLSSTTQYDLSLLSIKSVLEESSLFQPQKHRLSLLDEAKKALEESLLQMVMLELHSTSAGGTYMVRHLPSVDANDSKMYTEDADQHVLAVFKPRNEEIGQRCNPHGNCQCDREGFTPGSGSRREVLAYCLDHDHFAGIPPTLEVSAVYCLNSSQEYDMCSDLPETVPPSVCVGSLQLFVPNCIDAADVLPGKFLVEEVHALAIFDIRTLNSDRHGGNVLVHYDEGGCKSEVPHLVPIDHSYVCPAGYADPDYEWLSWPQSKVPFSLETLNYIQKLDASDDADLVAAALSANRSNPMGTTPPIQGPLLQTFETDPFITTTSKQVLQVQNKQWFIEDLWVTSSPLRQRQSTSYSSKGPSHVNFPKSSKHKEPPCDQHDLEDVQAAANTLYCATRLLQVAALEFGFTAYDIGNMCRRPRLTSPSLLEELIEGSLDGRTWETDRDLFEVLLIKRLEAVSGSIAEK
ncbi:unnamed protein product [Phytomonas sp. Hart1]|nr:unnamed protein product [Phytomonas sp. Hart1]|eukprot:CCW70471.1 unnamed protein product [Phytomonas sp. isolate Hart1]